jgi:endonuclease/exonuclease/phosphatase family metal-dependent hydrolase
MTNPKGRNMRASKRCTLQIMLFTAIAILCGWTTASSQNRGIGGKRSVDVATMNLYVGADFGPVTNLDPGDPNFIANLLNGVITIYGRILASNFPKRADALAQEIVARGPDVVALQEVTLLRRQSPGDSLLGGHTPATQVEVDYLAILLAALRQHGAHYAAISQVEDTDVELPLVTGSTTFDDLRLTDRDVILVRTDLPPGQFRAFNPQAANFNARIPLSIGGYVLRGWCSVDVQLRGRSFRVINTHVEDRLPAGFPDVQAAQTLELLAGPLHTSSPVILAGDFNADANGNYSPAIYPLVINQGGLKDAWSVARPAELGLTWGHDEFLANPAVPFLFRLDWILYRGSAFDAIDASVLDPVIGPPAPFWPSDHAQVFASFSIK